MTDPNCIFCKIIVGKIPANPIFVNDTVVVLPDIHPSAPGHLMVIPKRHGASILDYSEKELGTIMTTVQTMAQAIERALNCNSITIGINHLEKDGIHHLHIHLIPRFENDGGEAIQKVVHNPPQESLEVISEKIKKFL